jgi:hypothetical protein
MIELGVYRPEQYIESAGTSQLERRWNRMAYHLLRTSIPPSAAEIDMFEGIMQNVHLAAGVFRTTAVGRFQALDAFLAPLLEAHFGRSTPAPLLAADWAASACITSVEWFDSLRKSFPQVRLVASDLHMYLVEVMLPGGRASYIVEAGGEPIQYIRPPFVIPMNYREGSRLLVNRWLQSRAKRQFAKLAGGGALKSIGQARDCEEWKDGALSFRRIPLIHPTALALERSSAPAFTIDCHSVFDAQASSSHVIRTMNIFNVSYFKKEQLALGVRSVWQSLERNGVWLVGRTIEAVNHASVFEKLPTGFRLLGRHQSGSEIEDLALAFEA